MKNIFLKIFSVWIIIFLISGIIIFTPKKSEAQIPAQNVFVLGGTLIVSDPAHTGSTAGGWLAEAGRFALDKALKAALATLKKRLLDTLVDEIIQWIQGGGKPKFVEDFGGTLEKVANDSAGEIAQEIGLGDLCKPFKLTLQLAVSRPPTFSQKMSCTLDDIVGNIDDFMDDFNNGGWVAYNEIWKPQNNIYGAYIIAKDELLNRGDKKLKATETEIQSGRGFLSIKRCNEWSLFAMEGNTGENQLLDTKAVNEAFDYPNPSTPPPIPPDAQPPDYLFANWKCTNNSITTPGTAIANSLEKGLLTDLDFIANAEDLSNYVAAIADAAINRLIKEGVKGIQNMTLSETTTGQPTPYTLNLSPSTQNAAGSYNRTQGEILNETKKTYLQPINNALTSTNNAWSDLTNASSSFTGLIVLLQTLLANCPAQISWATTELNSVSSTIPQELTNKSNQVLALKANLLQKQTAINAATNISDIIAAQIDPAVITQAQGLEINAADLLKTIQDKTNNALSHLAQCTVGP